MVGVPAQGLATWLAGCVCLEGCFRDRAILVRVVHVGVPRHPADGAAAVLSCLKHDALTRCGGRRGWLGDRGYGR